MAKSELFVSILLLCVFFFTISLTEATSKEDDDITTTTQSYNTKFVPLTRLTSRTVNRRFPLKPNHQIHMEMMISNGAVPSGENGDFENPLSNHYHLHHHRHSYEHRHHDDIDSDDDAEDVDNHRVKKMVVKRLDLDRFDGEEIFKRIRKHRHGFDHHESGDFMKHVRKFLNRYV